MLDTVELSALLNKVADEAKPGASNSIFAVVQKIRQEYSPEEVCAAVKGSRLAAQPSLVTTLLLTAYASASDRRVWPVLVDAFPIEAVVGGLLSFENDDSPWRRDFICWLHEQGYSVGQLSGLGLAAADLIAAGYTLDDYAAAGRRPGDDDASRRSSNHEANGQNPNTGFTAGRDAYDTALLTMAQAIEDYNCAEKAQSDRESVVERLRSLVEPTHRGLESWRQQARAELPQIDAMLMGKTVPEVRAGEEHLAELLRAVGELVERHSAELISIHKDFKTLRGKHDALIVDIERRYSELKRTAESAGSHLRYKSADLERAQSAETKAFLKAGGKAAGAFLLALILVAAVGAIGLIAAIGIAAWILFAKTETERATKRKAAEEHSGAVDRREKVDRELAAIRVQARDACRYSVAIGLEDPSNARPALREVASGLPSSGEGERSAELWRPLLELSRRALVAVRHAGELSKDDPRKQSEPLRILWQVGSESESSNQKRESARPERAAGEPVAVQTAPKSASDSVARDAIEPRVASGEVSPGKNRPAWLLGLAGIVGVAAVLLVAIYFSRGLIVDPGPGPTGNPPGPGLTGNPPGPEPTGNPPPPENPTASLLSDANQLRNAGQWVTPSGRNAAALFRQVLAIDPTNGQALEALKSMETSLMNRARDERQRHDHDAAKRDYLLALQVNPRSEAAQAGIDTLRLEVEQESQPKTPVETVREGPTPPTSVRTNPEHTTEGTASHTTFVVVHRHGLGGFSGALLRELAAGGRGAPQGFCKGSVDVTEGGFSFATEVTSDNRRDDVRVPYTDIEKVERKVKEPEHIRIETAKNGNWDFYGEARVIEQLHQLITAHSEQFVHKR